MLGSSSLGAREEPHVGSRWAKRVLNLRVFKPVHLSIDRYFENRLKRSLGLVRNSGFAEDDVFIVGFPKSGNTWLQNLVCGIVYGVDLDMVPYTLVRDLVPGPGWIYHKRYRTPMFFTSHDLPRPEFRRVVYLVRDGRDVMVSYFHHLKAIWQKDIDFLSVVRGEVSIYPNKKWHEHVDAWLANPYSARMITIKYEDLRRGTIAELQRFCQFAGLERDVSFLELVAEKASFERMRQREVLHGMGKPGWPRGIAFVRRGETGSHKDEMPLGILEAFLKEAEDTLRSLGYIKG